MINEIERKFLVNEVPNLSGLEKITLERHFLYIGNGIELRIQSNGTRHTLQRKVSKSAVERETQTLEISLEEFDRLQTLSVASISRDSYRLADTPKTDLHFYSGKFQGLVRAEFEFSSLDESNAFIPPLWVGKEITDTPLARDSQLQQLNEAEFRELLSRLS